MQLLFDFLIGRKRNRRQPDAGANGAASPATLPTKQRSPSRPRAPVAARPQKTSMEARYDAVVRDMKAAYGFRVNKWRRSMTGCAWIVYYHDGAMSRLLEAPYPKGPMSLAIFLHEVGHHAIGFGTYKPRCLEEYYAWKWSLDTMRERGFNVTESVERRMRESLEYAVEKAIRRGLKQLPLELQCYARTRVN